MVDLNLEQNIPKIKKEIITREIHQWRNSNGTYAEKEERRSNLSTVSLSYELKIKLGELREKPTESYRSIIQRLVKEHFVLQLIKKKMRDSINEKERQDAI